MPASKQQFSLIDKYACAIRTQDEVARIMTERGYPMGKARVWQIERKALQKLRDRLAAFYSENFSS